IHDLRALLIAFVVGVTACDPKLAPPGGGGTASGPSSLELAIEPSAPIDRAPRILRLHASLPTSADLTRVAIVLGDVGAHRLRGLAPGDIPAALRDRMGEREVWRGPDGRVVAAPLRALEPGETYSFAAGDPPLASHFRIAEEFDATVAARVWPPPEQSA